MCIRDRVIAEYDDSGGSMQLKRKFIYGPGIDEPICMIDVAGGGGIYYYHFDGLGSVVALSDNAGAIVERYEYSAYGKTQILSPNYEPRTTSSYENPYMFTGRRFDPETQLYYYRARMYHPDLGRFIQPDPIGYLGGFNLYAYVENNPLKYIDPFGLDKKERDEENYRFDWGWPIIPGDAFWDRTHQGECPSTGGFWRHCMSTCRLRRAMGASWGLLPGLIGIVGTGDYPGGAGWGHRDSVSDMIAYIIGNSLGNMPSWISCRTLCDMALRLAPSIICVSDRCPVHSALGR